MRMLRELWSKDFPTYNNDYGTLMANVGDVVPKPVHKNIPMYVTGHVGGVNLDWIAKNSDGWIYYPRDFAFTKKIVQDWEEALQKEGQPKKPYIQPVYIDLMEDPNFEPQKIDLGFRLGRTYLIDMFQELEKIGVNHTMLVFKYCSRPAGEVLEEIGKDILPQLKYHYSISICFGSCQIQELYYCCRKQLCNTTNFKYANTEVGRRIGGHHF